METENDKKPKIVHTSKFLSIFVKFLTDFVDWNDERVNKAHVCCPVVFFVEIIALFKLKKSQIGTEIDKKTQNFQTFKLFMQFLSTFREFVD